MPGKNINYTPEDFYEFGKKRFSQTRIAEHYGISGNSVWGAMKKSPHLKIAYEAGKNGKPLPFSLEPKDAAAPQPNITPVAETLETDSPEAELSYSDIEEKILAAIDEHCCTLPQIKKHAGIEPRFEISDVLDGMETDGKISRNDNGTITAFFRKEWKIRRFWLNGGNKVGIEFEPDSAAPQVKLPAITAQIATEPRFEPTIKHVSENGRSKQSIEKVKDSSLVVAPPVAGEAAPNGHANLPEQQTAQLKTVELGGATLLVGFRGNIFDVPADARRRLNEIIDLVQEI